VVSVLWCWNVVVGPVSDHCPNKEDTQNTFVSSHHIQLTLCVCVCVCVYVYIYIYMYIYIYIYIYNIHNFCLLPVLTLTLLSP